MFLLQLTQAMLAISDYVSQTSVYVSDYVFTPSLQKPAFICILYHHSPLIRMAVAQRMAVALTGNSTLSVIALDGSSVKLSAGLE